MRSPEFKNRKTDMIPEFFFGLIFVIYAFIYINIFDEQFSEYRVISYICKRIFEMKEQRMKRAVVLSVVVALFGFSCGNNNARGEQKNAKSETVAAAEAAETGNPAPEMTTGEGGELAAATGNNSLSSAPADGGTILLTKAAFLKNVWNYETSPQQWVFLGDRPALIDFYADWCGPCKIASPILEEISQEFDGKIRIYKIDTQREQELAAVFGVRSIPAFLYIPRNGKPTMMAGIGRSKEETKKMFVDNINKLLLNTK
jgi:thioredoxin